MGHLGPLASGGPWGGPARVWVSRPTQLPLGPPACCPLSRAVPSAFPQAAWSLLCLQEAAAFLWISASLNYVLLLQGVFSLKTGWM